MSDPAGVTYDLPHKGEHCTGGWAQSIAFLDRLDFQSTVLQHPIDSKLLRVTHLLLKEDQARAVESAKNGFADSTPDAGGPGPKRTVSAFEDPDSTATERRKAKPLASEDKDTNHDGEQEDDRGNGRHRRSA